MSFARFMSKVLSPVVGADGEGAAVAAQEAHPHGLQDELTHHSGWVREGALKALVRAPQAAALPLLLVRVNDWVPQVRAAACDAVRALLRPDAAAAWRQALPEVVALTRAGRADHAVLLNEIAAFLSSPAVLPEVMGTPRRDAPLPVQRYVRRLHWLGMPDAADRKIWLKAALLGHDIQLAGMAMANVPSLPETADRVAVWTLALTSPFSRVRFAALGSLKRATPEGLPAELLHALALDPHAAMRRSAWGLLPEVGQAEVKAMALARAEDRSRSARHRVAALGLLAEVDFERVRPFCLVWAAEPLPAILAASGVSK